VQALYFNGSALSIRRFSVYDGFGKRHWDKTSSGAETNAPGSVGFAGQWGAYTDHETRMSQLDTPLVLMGIRYYDPITARFVTRDPALGINDYAYCGNNPVGRVDADGQIVETIADVASIGWSTYDLIKNPSWANLGYLAWDVGATAVPFVPGSYVAKGAKIASKAVHAVRGAKVAKAVTKGYKTFRAFKQANPNKVGHVWHHIVEQRMVKRMAGKAKFAAERIHGKKNLIELPNAVHNKISAFYSSKNTDITGKGYSTVRDWLNTKSFEEQSKFGRRVVDHFLHGKPL
jgi:RHS repeat-associated protein